MKGHAGPGPPGICITHKFPLVAHGTISTPTLLQVHCWWKTTFQHSRARARAHTHTHTHTHAHNRHNRDTDTAHIHRHTHTHANSLQYTQHTNKNQRSTHLGEGECSGEAHKTGKRRNRKRRQFHKCLWGGVEGGGVVNKHHQLVALAQHIPEFLAAVRGDHLQETNPKHCPSLKRDR